MDAPDSAYSRWFLMVASFEANDFAKRSNAEISS